MNLRKKIFFAFIISLFFTQNLVSAIIPENITGITLSNQIYDFLNRNNLNPQKENLVSNGKNIFPYNIILNFNTSLDIKKNVIFVFNQEDVPENQDLINNFCQNCKQNSFPVTILFSYGESNYKSQNNIQGNSIFIQNELDTTIPSTAIIVKLSQNKNSIISSSNGKTSPSWLIKSIYNLIIENSLDFNLPPYYLSQLYTFSFSKDSNLDEFFNVDIPCVKLSFDKKQTADSISLFLKEVLELFDEDTPMNFDQHFMILSIFGSKYFRMNEQFIVICVISIIFVFLVFLFLLFFIDSQRRNSALTRLKNNWHPLVFTFIIIIASFLLGKGSFMMLQKNITSISKIFILYVFQMIISLFLCFAFFTFEYMQNTKINPQAVEYTVILSTFINQFIFLYVDISLFPIFSIICILSVIAKYIKKNFVQIPILILMTVPFLIYAYLLLKNSQIGELKQFLLSSERSLLALSFILCPIYLKLDCIFISFAQKAESKNQVIKFTTIIVSIFCLTVIVLSIFYAHLGTKNEINSNITVVEIEDNNSIDFNYSDSHVFDDKVRTISLKIPDNTVSCELILSCEAGSPILYSDNTFFVLDKNKSMFAIPSNPPSKMWFTFGALDKPMTVDINIICPDFEQNTFIMKKKTVKIDS